MSARLPPGFPRGGTNAPLSSAWPERLTVDTQSQPRDRSRQATPMADIRKSPVQIWEGGLKGSATGYARFPRHFCKRRLGYQHYARRAGRNRPCSNLRHIRLLEPDPQNGVLARLRLRATLPRPVMTPRAWPF